MGGVKIFFSNKNTETKRRRNWFNAMCVIIMVTSITGLILNIYSYQKKERLNQHYKESIEQLDIIIQKYVDLEPDLKKVIREFQVERLRSTH